MAKCFSFTASRDWFYRYTFAYAGLKSVSTDLGDGGTVMHCWIPRTHKPNKPTLLLIHGFGANAMWQWSELLRPFVSRFNIYVPDLLFFGESYTTLPHRTEAFQAQCLLKLLQIHGVKTLSLVGLSYGGFVGYSMAAQFPGVVERAVICCAGVCLEEKDLSEGLFIVKDLDEAYSILMPQTPEKLRLLVRTSFAKPAKILPSCFLNDFIKVFGITKSSYTDISKDIASYRKLLELNGAVSLGCHPTRKVMVMCKDCIGEKRELIEALIKDRRLSDLPKLIQPTLIIWGDQDKVFPLELGHRLKSHIGENTELVIIKNAGHALNLEKPKEFYKHLIAFLIDSSKPSAS